MMSAKAQEIRRFDEDECVSVCTLLYVLMLFFNKSAKWCESQRGFVETKGYVYVCGCLLDSGSIPDTTECCIEEIN